MSTKQQPKQKTKSSETEAKHNKKLEPRNINSITRGLFEYTGELEEQRIKK